jgi:hypothetical protein
MSALSSSSNSSGGSAPSSGGAQRVTYNEALDTLTAMFPALSPDVIKMVLELHVSDHLVATFLDISRLILRNVTCIM